MFAKVENPKRIQIEAYSSKQIISLPIEAMKTKVIKPEKIVKSSLKFEITAYSLGEEECGKAIGDAEYGLTASLTEATQWRTIAAPKSIPFGTKVYIPYFKDYPNKGVFVVEDRGSAITEGHIDVFMEDLGRANEFGRRKLDVIIISTPS